MTAQAFLALAVAAGCAGLALAWWIATQLDPAPGRLTGRAQLPSLPGGAGSTRGGTPPTSGPGGVDLDRAHSEALVWARQQTTAVLVDVARTDPDAEAVFVWAAAHRVMADRGVTPLPLLVRQAGER
jgi:hypothetical protein